ncbi:MAG: YdcF family protein [Alphaproteobacteria bacterium]
MSFHSILYKIFGWIINIDALILLAILIASALLLTRWWKGGRKILTISSALLILLVVLPFGTWGATFLENRFPELTEVPTDAKGIIILGGNFSLANTAERGRPCYNIAGGRLVEAAKLIRDNPNLEVVFSGRGTHPKVSESEITKEVFASLGIDTTNMRFEDQSRSTNQNAEFTAAMLKPQPGEKWLLVTSAIHMPRSVGLFRGAGFDSIIPCPVDYHTTGKMDFFFNVSMLRAFLAWNYFAREIAGMINAYMLGLSNELIPAHIVG